MFHLSAVLGYLLYYTVFFFLLYGDHRDLHVLTHSFPTLRSSDLPTPDVRFLARSPHAVRTARPVGSDGVGRPRVALAHRRKSDRSAGFCAPRGEIGRAHV